MKVYSTILVKIDGEWHEPNVPFSIDEIPNSLTKELIIIEAGESKEEVKEERKKGTQNQRVNKKNSNESLIFDDSDLMNGIL